jgi:hypothetical protein
MSRTVGRAAVALAMTALLVAGCGPVSDGTASPQPGGLLRPGAELDGMHVTTATDADTTIFDITCDPIIPQPGTYARECEVPRLQRLMIGYGSIAASPELLEQEWRAQRWQLYLDGREVDLGAFGTLPDHPFVGADVGDEVWTRLWAVTIVNPTPGQHTLRYVRAPVTDARAQTLDATWTFTVIAKLMPR